MTAIDHALDAAVDDPNLDFVPFNGVNLPDARPPDEDMAATLEARLDWLARRMASLAFHRLAMAACGVRCPVSCDAQSHGCPSKLVTSGCSSANSSTRWDIGNAPTDADAGQATVAAYSPSSSEPMRSGPLLCTR